MLRRRVVSKSISLPLLAAALLFGASVVHAACDLRKHYPHEGSVALSNGFQADYPTHADELDTYSIYGTMDGTAVEALLAPWDLHAIDLNHRALGVLSVYEYARSDFGRFREAYFVIPAERHESHGFFSEIGKLLKSFRRKNPSRELTFFHVRAWSDSENARLASKELWGIPSRPGEISIDSNGKMSVASEGHRLFEIQWARTPTLKNFAKDVFVYASGEASLWSPVRACGGSRLSRFDPERGDQLHILDAELQAHFTRIDFKPVFKEEAKGRSAVQFLPER